MDKRKEKRLRRKVKEAERRVNCSLLSSLAHHAKDKRWMEEEMSEEEERLFQSMMSGVGERVKKEELLSVSLPSFPLTQPSDRTNEPRTNRPKHR